MQTFTSRSRYGAGTQIFHWLTAILVVMAFYMGPGGSEERVYSSAVDLTRQVHETLGISVFAIVVLRILWRLKDRVPEDVPMPPWMKFSSKLVQLVLYSLLIVTPISAIVGAWLEGHPLTLLAFGNVGPMLSKAHALGQPIARIHTFLGDAILWVAGLHAAAALFHHFILRDGVLLSMLPGRQ
ncbi:MAG: cytochrome b [Casimicrobiaceae bacterium]